MIKIINSNELINLVTSDLKDTINVHQEKLDTINNAFKDAEDFLLNNNVSELSDDDDILQEVIKCLKSIKNQIYINEIDIENINSSLLSLNNVSCGIDNNITSVLNDKILSIEKENLGYEEKINDSNSFLDVLLNLEIACPACSGKGNKSCSFCNSSRILTISSLFKNETLLEFELSSETNSQEDTINIDTSYYKEYTPQTKEGNKFMISKRSKN